MDMLTDVEVARLDDSNPEFERATPFAKMADGFTGNVVSFTLDKSAGAFNTATAIFTAPYAMRIIDVIVNAQVTEGSGTAKILKGTTEICTAIACAADGAVTHMSAGAVVANKARLVLAAGDVVNTQAAGGTAANIRGIITVVGQRL